MYVYKMTFQHGVLISYTELNLATFAQEIIKRQHSRV